MSKSLSHDMGEAPASPAVHEVQAQLNRILASPDFPASPRNRRFFAHVVEQSLQGRKTSGYEVATQVFGRPSTFNATTDPIVRIEAGKLRRDLETYYLKSGKHDAVRIELPRGGYRAVFRHRAETEILDSVPAASLPVLRAALLGWSGRREEAVAAWTSLRREYPDTLLNRRVLALMEKLHGRDECVRELLLEGLRRAADPAEERSEETLLMACPA